MRMSDIGAHLIGKAGGAVNIVAAGAGDNVEVDGPIFDRRGKFSAKVYVVWEATLGQDETLSIGGNMQHGDDSGLSDAADVGTALASAVVATGGPGGSTESGVTLIGDFDLRDWKRYGRAQWTPDLSASATDTARLACLVMLGGADELPAA